MDVVSDGLKDHPEDKVVLVSRASALRSELRNDESLVRNKTRLVEKFPNEPVIHRIKADLLGDRNTEKALPFYETALDLSVKKRRLIQQFMWNMSLHLLLRARKIKERVGMLGTGVSSDSWNDGAKSSKRINDMNEQITKE